MPRLEYFLVSESTSVDSDQNMVSIFNILDAVSFPKSRPMVIPQLVAHSSWIFDPEDVGKDFQVTLEIVLPGWEGAGNTNESLRTNFVGPPEKRQRIFQRVMGLLLLQPGDVVFHLLLNGEHKASHTLTVQRGEDDD
jgi:hypothetical protein